jgi:ubiquinone/menaquinone biosynthesis C-methylase UbiE
MAMDHSASEHDEEACLPAGKRAFTGWLRLNRLPYLVFDVSPSLGRVFVRLWYQIITRFDPTRAMTFMNYGYADADGSARLALDPADEVNRYCIQLYHHLTSAVDIEGRDVLEIGCGRGGGSAFIARYLKPGSVTGVDIAHKAVDFCNSHYSVPGLSYVQGDAETLEFPDASFDVVINVESSHYYRSMARFLCEVRRVLRPGGHLLLVDFRSRRDVPKWRAQFGTSGFEVVREETITTNIFRALVLDNQRKLDLIHEHVPWLFRKVFKEFASTQGTSSYESFRHAHWEYLSFILRKTGHGLERAGGYGAGRGLPEPGLRIRRFPLQA